jgi:eukaryotic-like serine/threonine-protein kinase
MDGPEYKLEGLTLDGGWKVGRMHRPEDATGGQYSVCYFVERAGQKAFLKALGFSRAAREPDLAIAVQALTEAYNFERNLLQTCLQRRMDRVVSPLHDGSVRVDESTFGAVPYLILEWADRDVRAQLALFETLDRAWRLRSLHHIATGLGQLHKAGIAHQDVKPSNILVFGNRVSKVADLGRAALKGTRSPADEEKCAGSKGYAPPELLYNYIDPEWNRRRLGTDLYLLGSMAMFFFTALSASASLLAQLAPEYHPTVWTGTYQDVLPYVRNAFGSSIRTFGEHLTDDVRNSMVTAVTQLCEPDPALRGHPLNRATNQFSLERYIALFDLLARRAEVELARSGANG